MVRATPPGAQNTLPGTCRQNGKKTQGTAIRQSQRDPTAVRKRDVATKYTLDVLKFLFFSIHEVNSLTSFEVALPQDPGDHKKKVNFKCTFPDITVSMCT
ncbi:hypothetical protein NDU88_003637 [Pleurodeles waltl]|uniref:Uncharacterized protein n=1 Tax=Pleurodeles waltl TaxID=8319 RepID=A0AAV7V304_PLEWA|nr:hypothetical protein NDU88_003637 [Pleurodeles waltl]